jgi:NADH-quinone oxidoreductase subunit G
VDSPDRLLAPRRKESANGHPLTVEQVLDRAAEKIKGAIAKHGAKSIAVLGSAKSSNEDLFLLKRLFADELKVQNLDIQLGIEHVGKEDEILMKADLTPNRRGALELGVKPWGGSGASGDDIVAGAKDGDYEVLVVVNHDLTEALSAKELAKLDQNCDYILYLTTHENAFCAMADDVIPLAMWAEREASYTNFQGRVQRTREAFPPRGLAVNEWNVWRQIAVALGHTWPQKTPAEIFDFIGQSVSSFKGLTWEGLGEHGKMLTGVPEPAFRKVQAAHPLAAY